MITTRIIFTEFDRRDLNVCREKEEYRTIFHDASAERADVKARDQRKKGKAVKSNDIIGAAELQEANIRCQAGE
jgi:hypothetical protein